MALPNCDISDIELKRLVQQFIYCERPEVYTSGRKEVTTAGTAEPLVASSTPCCGVFITGNSDNTGGAPVTIGGEATVDGAEATRAGTPIYPGQTIFFKVADAATLWLDSENNNDGVSYNILS